MIHKPRNTISALLLALLTAAGCNTGSGNDVLPTVASLNTAPPAVTPAPIATLDATLSATLTATLPPAPTVAGGLSTLSALIGGTAAPAAAATAAGATNTGSTPAAGTAVSSAPTGTDTLTLDAQESSFISRQMTFVLRFTPYSVRIKSAVFRHTFPETGKSADLKVAVTNQKAGSQAKLQASMSVDRLPPGEEEVFYEWQLTDETGKVYTSEPQTFKITESIAAEQRKDRPILKAVQRYESRFPTASLFSVSFTHTAPVTFARFFMTQNNGIEQFDFEVKVPRHAAGDAVDLKFTWSNVFGVQIPWTQFESWWVFRDQNNKEWRTESAYNIYADKRFHQWKQTSTTHAELFTYNRSAADIRVLAQATDYSIERLSKEFDYKLLYRPHIIVYNTQADMADWAPAQWVDYFIGMASGQWGGAVVAFYDTTRFTGYSVIQHEMVHIFQYQSMRSVKQLVPKWWVEGSATYFEEQTDDVLGRVKQIVKRVGEPPSLMQGVGISAPDGSRVPWVYYVGSTFVMFLRESYGDAVFAEVQAAIARDIRFSDALKMATGKSLEQLNAEWQAWIMR
jgi:flavodoxin/predicted small secreted protein